MLSAGLVLFCNPLGEPFPVFLCGGVPVMRLTTPILVVLMLFCGGGGGGTALSMQDPDFVKDVQPLLEGSLLFVS
jgi:hypothetical protein